MKKEEMNNRDNAQSRYVSPSADVVDVNVQGVLCISGGTENYNDNTTPVDWFTIDEN